MTTLQASLFNVRVPLPEQGDVFLMNTLTDAQLIVSSDVAALLDRVDGAHSVPLAAFAGEELDAIETLRENGFVVADRAAERQELHHYFSRVKSDRSELHITVLTTLQCN